MSEAVKEEATFQVGDIVEHVTLGCVGSITGGGGLNNHFYVRWYDSSESSFFISGRYNENDKYPSIRLVDRPKKLVKKEAKVYLYRIELNHFRTLETYARPPLEHDYDDKRIPVIFTWEEES